MNPHPVLLATVLNRSPGEWGWRPALSCPGHSWAALWLRKFNSQSGQLVQTFVRNAPQFSSLLPSSLGWRQGEEWGTCLWRHRSSKTGNYPILPLWILHLEYNGFNFLKFGSAIYLPFPWTSYLNFLRLSFPCLFVPNKNTRAFPPLAIASLSTGSRVPQPADRYNVPSSDHCIGWIH